MTVVVSDNEFAQTAQSILTAAKELEYTAERLLANIDSLTASGIVSAKTTAALSEKKGEIDAVFAGLAFAIEPLSDKTSTFIDSIDEIDSFLY